YCADRHQALLCLGGGVTPKRYHPARRACIGSLPKLVRTQYEHMFSAFALKLGHYSIASVLLKRANRAHLRHVARASKFGSKKNPSRRYRVLFDVRADLAGVPRSISGGGCCSPAIAHQTLT